MRAVLSSDAVSTVVPLGWKEAKTTGLSCPSSPAICLPDVACQMRAVLSPPAVTTSEPSALKAAAGTLPVCPCRIIGLLPPASQILAVLSFDAVRIFDPSGLKDDDITPPRW